MSPLPWLDIPDAAQPGQRHAFADRELQLQGLYRALVEAGNAVRDGQIGVRHRHVVHGYKGVGKSALILQTLGLLRGELVIQGPGQHTDVDQASLGKPRDVQRWLVFHLSGKHVSSIEALSEEIASGGRAALEEVTDKPADPAALDIARRIHQSANRQLEHAVELPFFHKHLHKEQSKLYDQVKEALGALVHTLNYVAAWRGSIRTDRLNQRHSELSEVQRVAQIRAELAARFGVSGGDSAARVGLDAAARLIHKHWATLSSEMSSELERKWRVDARLVSEALNEFFQATDNAQLPTLLVLDDFDEFSSDIGTSHDQRAGVLRTILGPFQKLAPTCMVIGLRSEYLHEDIRRVFDETPVPAMSRAQFARVVEAWTEVQKPALASEHVSSLNALVRHLLAGFDHLPDSYDFDHQYTPIAVPFTLLRIVRHLASIGASTGTPPAKLLRRYVRDKLQLQAQRALGKLIARMPESDILDCAAALPLDPTPYDLRPIERRALERSGLWRPAIAADVEDDSIVIDPLAAYIKVAERMPTQTGSDIP